MTLTARFLPRDRSEEPGHPALLSPRGERSGGALPSVTGLPAHRPGPWGLRSDSRPLAMRLGCRPDPARPGRPALPSRAARPRRCTFLHAHPPKHSLLKRHIFEVFSLILFKAMASWPARPGHSAVSTCITSSLTRPSCLGTAPQKAGVRVLPSGCAGRAGEVGVSMTVARGQARLAVPPGCGDFPLWGSGLVRPHRWLLAAPSHTVTLAGAAVYLRAAHARPHRGQVAAESV